MKPLRIGELFCGPGGLGFGASLAKASDGSHAFEHAWANDIDPDTCATYLRNVPGAHANNVICKSVRELRFEQLSPIDLLAFGFPCNDFSVVGEQLGITGKFGPLYSYGVAAIDHFSPEVFLAENVSGLTSANEGKAFERIIHDLSNAGEGYDLVAHLYKAEEYNVPQKRRRVLIVGIRKDLPYRFQVPAPTSADRPPTVADALVRDPIRKDAKNHELTRQSPIVVERLKHIKQGENAFTATLPEELTLNIRGAKISQIYKRLSLDQPSYTITGSGGGGTHVYHWEENRALTNRERARLQGFPDSFVFCGSKESVRKQIGMAVPPPLAHAVVQAIVWAREGVEYATCSPNLEIRKLQGKLILEKIRAYN